MRTKKRRPKFKGKRCPPQERERPRLGKDPLSDVPYDNNPGRTPPREDRYDPEPEE